MRVGLVGHPRSGKTTLFRLLTGADASGKQDVSVGSARVPDERIDFLSDMFRPKKTTYARIELVDLTGVRADRPDGKGFARLVNHMRTVDALIHVVRAFEALEDGDANPLADASALTDELIIADMAVAETRMERLRTSRKRTADEDVELALMERLSAELGEGRRLREIELAPDEVERLRSYGLLSFKPVVIVANMSEGHLASGQYPGREALQAHCDEHGIPLVELAAQVEAEIAELPEPDRKELMAEYGIDVTGVEQVARAVYDSLGLISFFTVGEDEVRAWPIARGTVARRAAGKIHSDIERGFIRAETIAYSDLKRLGSMVAARSVGLFRLEGKEYVMQDGDIVNFRFSPQH